MPTPPRPPYSQQSRPPAPPPPPQQPKPPEDPQAAKLEAHAAPPRWDDPAPPPPPNPAWTPDPALDPRAQKPPAGVYADGMPVADEQRARAAWVEEQGQAKYAEAIDERPADERGNKQVPGVAPPAKRS